MPFRYCRLKDGTLLQGLIGSDGPFTIPAETHLKNLAEAHGLAPDELELVETSVPPDLTGARAPRAVEKSPDDVINETKRQVLALDPVALRAERDPAKLAEALATVVESMTAGIRRDTVTVR